MAVLTFPAWGWILLHVAKRIENYRWELAVEGTLLVWITNVAIVDLVVLSAVLNAGTEPLGGVIVRRWNEVWPLGKWLLSSVAIGNILVISLLLKRKVDFDNQAVGVFIVTYLLSLIGAVALGGLWFIIHVANDVSSYLTTTPR